MVQNINRLLAQSIGTLNAVLAVVFLLLGLSTGIAATAVIGPFGLIGGVIAGAAAAVTFCGLLAIAIRIRELLEECLRELRRGRPTEGAEKRKVTR